MDKIKIEKGIAMPSPLNGVANRYPFDEMEVGDSFYVPNVHKNFSIYSCVYHYNAKNKKDIKISQRRENNGVRIWRIA